jgi:heptosyltransferase I
MAKLPVERVIARFDEWWQQRFKEGNPSKIPSSQREIT